MTLLFFLTLLIAATGVVRSVALQRQLHAARIDPAYGILTRVGGEIAWRQMHRTDLAVIFTDLDDLHTLNDRLGYAEVNRRIATALQNRRNDMTIAMRWFSGDEIVIVVPRGDGMQTADRRLASLHLHELSGTFAVVAATSHNLDTEVTRAAMLVQAAKALNQRGIVINGDAR